VAGPERLPAQATLTPNAGPDSYFGCNGLLDQLIDDIRGGAARRFGREVITRRCVSTVGAAMRRSSSSAIGRPSSAARALAPEDQVLRCARPGAPGDVFLMKAGDALLRGRVIAPA